MKMFGAQEKKKNIPQLNQTKGKLQKAGEKKNPRTSAYDTASKPSLSLKPADNSVHI